MDVKLELRPVNNLFESQADDHQKMEEPQKKHEKAGISVLII